ncbi:unnamed protein product, partial [Adineta steineri]
MSLSSHNIVSSFYNKQIISFHYNTNNNEKQPVKTKSFDQTINRAVEYFQEILAQCTPTSSNTSLIHSIEQKKPEKSKRDCEDVLRYSNKKEFIAIADVLQIMNDFK